jgi:hypothetical protein
MTAVIMAHLLARQAHAVLEPDADALEQALALGQRLVGAVEAFAFQFEFAELGDIELPSSIAPAADRAHLHTVAPLYLAAELEAARLIPAVEMLAGIAISGGLPIDRGEAASLLVQFWQGRHTRFTTAERQAFFARLFGASSGPTLAVEGGENIDFEPLMIDLAEALYQLEPVPTLGSRFRAEIPLRLAAQRLAANLIPRSGGMAAFAARDLLRTLAEALAILKQEPVQQVLGARSVWAALRQMAQRYLQEEVDVSTHVTRGKAGLAVLAWLAEVLPRVEDDATALVSPDHPVVGEAAAWLQASLTLAEAQHQPASQRR